MASSDSADLSRLGLTQRHCELAVAELARAILIAGGTVIYGGRLDPYGFTHILMDEVRRYADGRDALTICLPDSEHRKLTDDRHMKLIDGLAYPPPSFASMLTARHLMFGTGSCRPQPRMLRLG